MEFCAEKLRFLFSAGISEMDFFILIENNCGVMIAE